MMIIIIIIRVNIQPYKCLKVVLDHNVYYFMYVILLIILIT